MQIKVWPIVCKKDLLRMSNMQKLRSLVNMYIFWKN